MLKRILAAGVLVAAAIVLVDAQPTSLNGGNGTMYIGGWPNRIFAIDEATEQVTSTIIVTTAGPPKGGPPRSMILSKNRKRFYLTNSLQHVEIIDIAARKSIDSFEISDGPTKRTFLRGMVADPLDLFVVPAESGRTTTAASGR